MIIESNDTILRLPQVLAKTGLSRTNVYGLIARGEFPQKLQLSPRTVGFLESEVNEWIISKISRRA
jgi:prophage regulatory protein